MHVECFQYEIGWSDVYICGRHKLLDAGQICKDKDEAEIWFVALRALISRGHYKKWRNEASSDSASSSSAHTQRNSPLFSSCSSDTVLKVC